MCGIAGQFLFKEDLSEEGLEAELVKMLSVIKHRGPDGQGVYCSENLAMGMRRLSIIGLENGWQPIWNENRTLVCVSNGEIYNYKELRKTLLKKGHEFSTDSDIEVVVHLYEEYGEKFVEQLNGMFAIALYDISNKTLFLYRDRIGKKPLYFYQSQCCFYFASEIKSIFMCKKVERALSPEALDYLLKYNYLPTEQTIYKNIYKVMPGEFLTVNRSGIHKKPYWNLMDSFGRDTGHATEQKILLELDDLLLDSVKLRLRSDVPVGAFLSGGVDSSIVVSYASRILPGIDTFSIGFQEEAYNELPYSRKVSAQFSTKHHEEIVDADFFKLLPRTIWLNDNPHGDISFLPTYALAAMTAKYVKTVLTGDGGDELFGGYEKYIPYMDHPFISESDFYENTSVFKQEDKKLLYGPVMLELLKTGNAVEPIESMLRPLQANYGDRLNRLLYLETKMLLEGNNLVKPDRMGMGNSIEARMPLLDYRIIEYVTSLPGEWKIRGKETKYILKRLAQKTLPEGIVYRKKQMFTVPVGEWMRGALKDLFYKILLSERCISRGLFNPDYVKQMLDHHISGKANYTRQLRLLIIIELWHRIFIDDCYSSMPEIDTLL